MDGSAAGRYGRGVDLELVGRAEGVVAVRARGKCCLDVPVRVLGQRTGHPGAARARRLREGIGQVRLPGFRGRQAGVVRRLRWGRELCLQFCNARGQGADLLRLRLNLRMLRQDQRDQLITGESEEGRMVHAAP